MKVHSILILTIAVLVILYTMVKFHNKEGSIVYLILGIVLFCLGGCVSKKTETNRLRLIKEYVANKYKDTVNFIHVNIDMNEGNLFNKEFSHSGTYRTTKVNEKDIHIKFYIDKDSLSIVYDYYFIEKAYMGLEQKIENSINDVDFVISLSPIVNQEGLQDLDYSTPLDELRTRVYTNTSDFVADIRVIALDFKENREKYLQFHIDLMRVLKENNIEKGKLYFKFYNYDINLEHNRPKARHVDRNSSIKRHQIEHWSSIHNNKWYDLVKNHPDKVLKYGKVFKN